MGLFHPFLDDKDVEMYAVGKPLSYRADVPQKRTLREAREGPKVARPVAHRGNAYYK